MANVAIQDRNQNSQGRDVVQPIEIAQRRDTLGEADATVHEKTLGGMGKGAVALFKGAPVFGVTGGQLACGEHGPDPVHKVLSGRRCGSAGGRRLT